ARARRFSRRLGQRFDSLKALAEAVKIARERDMPAERWQQLRNEAIACLALPDLRRVREWDGFPDGSQHVAFDGSLRHYARTDREGTCHVHRVADAAEIARLPGLPRNEVWPALSPDGRFVGLHFTPVGLLRLWRLDGAQPQLLLNERLVVSAWGFSPRGDTFVIGSPE